jgi:hypothetical protein
MSTGRDKLKGAVLVLLVLTIMTAFALSVYATNGVLKHHVRTTNKLFTISTDANGNIIGHTLANGIFEDKDNGRDVVIVNRFRDATPPSLGDKDDPATPLVSGAGLGYIEKGVAGHNPFDIPTNQAPQFDYTSSNVACVDLTSKTSVMSQITAMAAMNYAYCITKDHHQVVYLKDKEHVMQVISQSDVPNLPNPSHNYACGEFPAVKNVICSFHQSHDFVDAEKHLGAISAADQGFATTVPTAGPGSETASPGTTNGTNNGTNNGTTNGTTNGTPTATSSKKSFWAKHKSWLLPVIIVGAILGPIVLFMVYKIFVSSSLDDAPAPRPVSGPPRVVYVQAPPAMP